jgi:hypothetical protein
MRIYDMIGRWDDGLTILVESAPLVRWNGDEPRRARFNALLARCLARTGYHEQAEGVVTDGLAVSERLGLRAVAAGNRASLGSWSCGGGATRPRSSTCGPCGNPTSWTRS